jgi:transglutaminase-like putative cysteine protease
MMGYISTWYFMKKQNAWTAVIIGAVAVLVNLSNLPHRYYFFFGIYFVVAIIFVVQNRISRQEHRTGSGPILHKNSLRYFMAVLAGICILAVSISWVTPVLKAPQLETWVATKTLWTKDIKDSGFNFFAYVMAKQPKATSSARRSLGFGSSWHQKDDIHFIVHSELPAYWQVFIYDEYTSHGWVNSQLTEHMLDENVPWESSKQYLRQSKITSMVEAELKTDIILTAGEFNSSDTSVFVHESDGEIIAVTIPRLLKPGESYEIISFVSSATTDELSKAGEDYPRNITDKYLQLPPEFPDSVRTLSANITRNASTPYDRMMAIDEYLAGFTYEEDVEPPPADVDGVEHFLTVQKSGFCTYFASAMVVMLRSVDVPARLAVGYLPGERGDSEGEYILKDRHYHAWPQVYFPRYGWINIEATPGAAGSSTAGDTPPVSSYSAQPGEPMLPPDWWQIPYWPNGQIADQGVTSGKTAVIESSWPFADELGRTISVIFFIVLAGLLVMVVLLAFKSRFDKWLWKVVRNDSAGSVYSRLCALGALAKIGPKPQQTPLEYSAVLASEFPAYARDINSITQTYLDNRFGSGDNKLNLMEEAVLLKARREVFTAILERLGFFNKVFRRSL